MQSLGVHFHPPATSGYLAVEFNIRLQEVGRDLTVYANTFGLSETVDSAFNDKWSDALKLMVNSLFREDLGVERISASPFKLQVYYSRASPRKAIQDCIRDALKQGGYRFVEVNEDGVILAQAEWQARRENSRWRRVLGYAFCRPSERTQD